MVGKIAMLGLGQRVLQLHQGPNGAVLPANRIADVLKSEGHRVSTGAVKYYLKQIAKQQQSTAQDKPERTVAAKNAVISPKEDATYHVAQDNTVSVEMLDKMILQGHQKLKELGYGKDNIKEWALAVRAQLALLKLRMADSDFVCFDLKTLSDEDLLVEYERIEHERKRVEEKSYLSRNRTQGTTFVPKGPSN